MGRVRLTPVPVHALVSFGVHVDEDQFQRGERGLKFWPDVCGVGDDETIVWRGKNGSKL